MKLPKRPDTHLTETKSWNLLQSIAPDNWIVREITERDYGIDCYIEICTEEGLITGDLISVQLKGTKSIDWNGSSKLKTARSPSIKVETASYWFNLPVPVFLFVADLSEKAIYFKSVEVSIRNQYDKLDEQDTISFKLIKEIDIASNFGKSALKWFYAREKNHDYFKFHMTNLLNNIESFNKFIRFNQNRDIFLEVEPERHMKFRGIYESCKIVSHYLDIKWEIDSLINIYKKDLEKWKDKIVYLHEETLGNVLEELEKIFPQLVKKSIKLVTETQASYWSKKDPVFYNLCKNNTYDLSSLN